MTTETTTKTRKPRKLETSPRPPYNRTKERSDKGVPKIPDDERSRYTGFRMDADNARRLDAYLADIDGYNKTETLNCAVKCYLDIEMLPCDGSDAWEQIQGILARYYEGYVRTRAEAQDGGIRNE